MFDFVQYITDLGYTLQPDKTNSIGKPAVRTFAKTHTAPGGSGSWKTYIEFINPRVPMQALQPPEILNTFSAKLSPVSARYTVNIFTACKVPETKQVADIIFHSFNL